MDIYRSNHDQIPLSKSKNSKRNSKKGVLSRTSACIPGFFQDSSIPYPILTSAICIVTIQLPFSNRVFGFKPQIDNPQKWVKLEIIGPQYYDHFPRKTQETDLSQKDNDLENKHIMEENIFWRKNTTKSHRHSHSHSRYNQVLCFDSISLDYQISTSGTLAWWWQLMVVARGNCRLETIPQRIGELLTMINQHWQSLKVWQWFFNIFQTYV